MSQDVVKIPRTEHLRLLNVEAAYEKLQQFFFSQSFIQPSTKDRSLILKELRKTKKYSPAFLKSLAQGLNESNYFNGSV